MNKLIKSIEHYVCPGDDRYIYVERLNGKIVGLNFCQGVDDYESFLEGFCRNDHELLLYYNSIKQLLHHISEDEIEQINEAIWAFVRFNDPYEQYN